MKKLQKVEKMTQTDKVKIDVLSTNFKPWLGINLNLVNWNTILADHVKLSNATKDRKKTPAYRF